MKKLESAGEMIDKILEDETHKEICEKFDVGYYITNYAVTCDDKLLCFTGSDIIDADNIRNFLRRKYPDHEFDISEEFMGFS